MFPVSLFRRLTRSLFLLAGDRLGLALAGARIGLRALTADRQALALTQPAIAGEVDQALDVHRDFAAKIPFHRMVARSEDHTSELQSLMRTSFAVFCWTKKNNTSTHHTLLRTS